MVSAPAAGDRSPGFDPHRSRRNLVLEYASLCIICREDMNSVHRLSDRDVN